MSLDHKLRRELFGVERPLKAIEKRQSHKIMMKSQQIATARITEYHVENNIS